MHSLTDALEREPVDDRVALVRDFYRLAYEERKPGSAARLLDRTYRRHSAGSVSDRKAYAAQLEEIVGTFPFLQFDLTSVTMDGDLVVALGRLVSEPGSPGETSHSSFRVAAGKIVEQWEDGRSRGDDHPARGPSNGSR